MANRDYVRKGNVSDKSKRSASKKTKRPTKGSAKKAPNSTKKFPVKMAIITAILLVGFMSLIAMLQNDPSPKQDDKSDKAAQAQEKVAKTETIPPPPEEKWDYIQSLPEREIKVKAKEQAVSKVPYIMQCGAYKRAGDANQRKANIALQGLSSQVVRQKGGTWYRVVLGPYKFKRDAVKDQHKLQRVKIEPCLIMMDYLKLIT